MVRHIGCNIAAYISSHYGTIWTLVKRILSETICSLMRCLTVLHQYHDTFIATVLVTICPIICVPDRRSRISFRLFVPKNVPGCVPLFCSIYVPQVQDAPVMHQNGRRKRYSIKVAGLRIEMKDAKMRQYVRGRATAGLKQKRWNKDRGRRGEQFETILRPDGTKERDRICGENAAEGSGRLKGFSLYYNSIYIIKQADYKPIF